LKVDFTQKKIELSNNKFLAFLVGASNVHIEKIESAFEVSIAIKGNNLFISGYTKNVDLSAKVINYLYEFIKNGKIVNEQEVDLAIKLKKSDIKISDDDLLYDQSVGIITRKKTIIPRTKGQQKYIELLKNKDMVFCLGPAGTGKTYLAVAYGVYLLTSGKVEKIILSRPAVEAGEKLGFLPGDMKEKVDPYLRPLYDALYDMLPHEQLEKRFLSNDIEIAPLAFMRGRTLSNSFIILDEAQNATSSQMKMFLTRLGNGSKMVITGDPSQVDLVGHGVISGLTDATKKLFNIDEIGFIELDESDVVRHPLISKIVLAYNKNT
jgi:phosphate starvation-inducible protein PhoH and related proteins